MVKQYGHHINGQWQAPSGGEWIDCVNPANGETFAQIARGNVADVDTAVEAAIAVAQTDWKTNTQKRIDVLNGIADVLESEWDTLVEHEVSDNGKRVKEVRGQFSGLHLWYRYFATEVDKIKSHPLHNTVANVENHAAYEPYGVVAAITPWNSPLMIAAWKIAPALAAGNVVVLKPSEHASVSTLLFADLINAAGIPVGLINVVTGFGTEVGAALVSHQSVRKVSFTGSDAGGVSVASQAAVGLKPVTLELGGKSPQIVFADADLDNAINGVLSGIFLSNGQSCIAGSRLIVEASVLDQFTQKLIDRVNNFSIGDPMVDATDVGPLANAPQFEKVMAMIDTAKREGAVCVHGGNKVSPSSHPNGLANGLANGLYVEPTIFSNVTQNMQLWREEVFGPVLAVTSFSTFEEAIKLANDTEYGLAAGVWTSNESRAARLAGSIEAGTVYINHYRDVSVGSPIGGFKRSGYGRELGPDAVKDYMQIKSVWHGMAPVADPFK